MSALLNSFSLFTAYVNNNEFCAHCLPKLYVKQEQSVKLKRQCYRFCFFPSNQLTALCPTHCMPKRELELALLAELQRKLTHSLTCALFVLRSARRECEYDF